MYIDLEAELHDLFWNQEDVISEFPILKEFHAQKLSLEIGCGSGRLLLPLLENGCPIDGVEISADMTKILTNSASQRNLEPDIHTCNILDFKPIKTYERVSIPAFTCQLLDRPSLVQTLRNIYDFTTYDGELYLTCFIPWAEIAGELPEGDWYEDHQAKLSDGSIALCKTKFSINRLRQTLNRRHQYSITGKGKKRLHRSTQDLQWYTYPEILLLLESTGWQVKQLITDLDQVDNPNSNAHILTIIASKIEHSEAKND